MPEINHVYYTHLLRQLDNPAAMGAPPPSPDILLHTSLYYVAIYHRPLEIRYVTKPLVLTGVIADTII